MKKTIRYMATVAVLLGLFLAYAPNSYAVTYDDLDGQEQMQASNIGYVLLYYGGEDDAFECLKAYMPSNRVVQVCVDTGMFPNHIDDLKALGYTDVDYSHATSGTSEPQPATQENASAPDPTAFTVEDMPETPMWAASEVNYRDGASTDYNKIGSLTKDEEVTVNGRASTGWYRFVLADGTEAYVSDKYLTAEDPNVATEPEEAAPEPEPEEEPVAEEPKVETPEPVVEEPEIEMPEPEPVVEEPEQIVEPPVVEEEATGNWIPIAVGVAAAVCVIGGVSFVLIRRKKV